MADFGSATPQGGYQAGVPLRSMGTGLTWPPELPFSLALERARNLERSALGMLYRRYVPVVYRYVLARVGREPVAEDITSEVFFALLEGIRTMRAHDELGFAAWLLGIARNKVSMHFRKIRVRPEVPMLPLENQQLIASAEEGDPLMIITARESWAEVVAALNHLTEEQRAVVLYRCVLGYSTEDTAQLLEKRPNAIRALQFRALASLTRYLGVSEEIAKRSQTSTQEGGEG